MEREQDEFELTEEGKGLLGARRRFLIGSAGLSAFAATLTARRASAWSGGGCGPVTALCSPTHSNINQAASCVGNHCDHYCNNVGYWNAWSYKNSSAGQTFSQCGWSSPSGCSVNASTRLCDALSACYTESGSGSHARYTFSTGSISAWLACGLLNCNEPCSTWYYTTSSFISACQSVYNNKCGGTPESQLTSLLASICTANRPSGGYCSGSSCLWNNW